MRTFQSSRFVKSPNFCTSKLKTRKLLTGGAEGGLGVRHGRRGMENDGSCMVRQVELERCWQFFKAMFLDSMSTAMLLKDF